MKSLLFIRNLRQNIGLRKYVPIYTHVNYMKFSQRCFSSNFRPLEPEAETTPEKKYYRPYDPNRAEPEIDPEDFKRMQDSLHKFS